MLNAEWRWSLLTGVWHSAFILQHFRQITTLTAEMLHYFKFRQDLFAPVAAKDVYVKRGKGKGWPEECPPIRAANGFGFDLLSNFDVIFRQKRNKQWTVEPDVVISSDFGYAASEESAG